MFVDNSVTINYEWRDSGFAAWNQGVARYSDTFEMASINNYPIDTNIDDGSPWLLIRSQDKPTFVNVTGSSRYRGPLTCASTLIQGSYASLANQTDGDVIAFGTSAIAKTAPTNPAFDLATALGELRMDGLPAATGSSLLRERTAIARSAGSEYLNYEFGWLPLLSDIQGFAKAVKNSGAILNQYRKGSDVKIRERYDVGGLDQSRVLSGGILCSPTDGNVVLSGGQLEHQRRRSWFSGAFRYHIPTSDTQLGKFQQWMSMSDHLLGWKVTPETVWNIAPWSWAVDWFSNTGDVIANISNLGKDGLVLQYGYSMAENIHEIDTWALIENKTATRSIKKHYKRRLPATPYGFGVNLDALSSKQIAIIAALGLSRT